MYPTDNLVGVAIIGIIPNPIMGGVMGGMVVASAVITFTGGVANVANDVFVTVGIA